jgi:Transmembrane protein 18
MAERINSFLGKNWKSFSSQNYFDPNGLFISVLWSGPLILITILIVVCSHLFCNLFHPYVVFSKVLYDNHQVTEL